MKFPCTIKQLIDGQWQARSVGSSVGNVEVTASTKKEAVDKLRDEIRYRVEWCPCSSVAEDYVELDIEEKKKSPWRGSVF